jgi:hypothetical protein
MIWDLLLPRLLLHFCFVLVLLLTAIAATPPWIDPEINLSTAGPLDITLAMRGGSSLRDLPPMDEATPRHRRREIVHAFLSEGALASQRCVRASLSRHHGPGRHTGFWIANVVSVRKIPWSALRLVLDECSNDIAAVTLTKGHWRSPPTAATDVVPDGPGEDLQWNIQRVGADKAWSDGFDGTGVVVATLDGGVRYDVAFFLPWIAWRKNTREETTSNPFYFF